MIIQFTTLLIPGLDDLPLVKPLTDPLLWSDGHGRTTRFNEWSQRRAAIKTEIEHYEIGKKPPRPDMITASYTDGVMTVNITENNETLILTSQVSLPEGTGPFPSRIGIGRGKGSLSSEMFEELKVARSVFNFTQIKSHTQRREMNQSTNFIRI